MGAMSMLKNAGMAGAGAVGVDIGMGYLGRVLPSAAAPINADGTTNWLYFAAKAGLAVGLGVYGSKVLPASVAQKMGEGALTVLSYQILRGLMPAGVQLGTYFNPAPTMRPRLAGGSGSSGSGRDGASFAGSARGSASLGIYDNGDAAGARAANIVALARSR